MKKSLFAIGMLFTLPTSTLLNAEINQPAQALPSLGYVNMYFSPTSAASGEPVTLHWSYSGPANSFGCDIFGVPGISYVSDYGSYSFTASQSLNAFITCEVIDEFYQEIDFVDDTATFTLLPTLNLDFDLNPRNSYHTGPRYAKIEVVNPVDLSYCDGDGIRWIQTSGNYSVTCYDANGNSKTKSIYLSVD